MKGENEPLHHPHTFPLQKNKVFVSSLRKKHFRQYTNPQPGERNNGSSHLPFRCDIPVRDKCRGSAVFLFPFHGSAHCWYACAITSRDFAEHKMYPAYRGRDDIRVN